MIYGFDVPLSRYKSLYIFKEKKRIAEGVHAALIYQIFIAESGDDTRDLKEMSLYALK